MANSSPAQVNMTCRICRSNRLILFLRLDKSPRQLSHLLHADERHSDTTAPLFARQCAQCGFVQLHESGPMHDYSEYEMSWMHIPTLADYRKELAKNFVSRFCFERPSVLDVGCGSGDFLKCLTDAGAFSSGLEPSRPLVLRAIEAGFNVTHGLVGTEAIDVGKIDGWTCLQVLEHVPDPVAFLATLRGILTKGGVGLVEVPSLELIISERRFYDFFRDHLNYFTESTLRLTCELAGFRVIEIRPGLNRQFHVAMVTPAEELYFDSFGRSLDELLGQLRNWFMTLKNAGKRIAVWGAGYKSIAAITAADLKGFEYVIDSDPTKHGRFTPGSHLEIRSPLALTTHPVDAIVLASVAYKQEILQQLRNELLFKGEVVALSSVLEVL